MNTINITINDLSTLNTSSLNKIIKQMRRDEYLKIMTAFPVGRENAMTAKQIAAITNTTPEMVMIAYRGNISSYDVTACLTLRNHGLKSEQREEITRWAELDDNGNPTGVVRQEIRPIHVYWVKSKITLDDLI